MDFSLTEDQQAARELAATIFKDLSTHERLREVEATESRFDDKLWAQLAAAGPARAVGARRLKVARGSGFLESCVLAEEAGRSCGRGASRGDTRARCRADRRLRVRGAPRPVAARCGLRFDDPVRRARRARRRSVCAGHDCESRRRRLAHRRDEDVRPCRACSPTPSSSRPVSTVAAELFCVPCDANGVSRTRQVPTSGQPEAQVDLDGVRVGADDLLRPSGESLRWLVERAEAALCVQMAGACKAAVEMTARYTSERRQFGKPIAEFQAVGQRAADAYVDAEAVRLTAWQAAWRLDAGLPASAEVAVAKFWADDGAQRVVHGCQHLHGGCRRRPRLPGPPLLLDDQAPCADARRHVAEPAAARRHPGSDYAGLAEPRARPA